MPEVSAMQITATEFKNNIGKYLSLASKENIYHQKRQKHRQAYKHQTGQGRDGKVPVRHTARRRFVGAGERGAPKPP